MALCAILQIRIDGQDIRGVTLESLRKSIGVVPQDTVSDSKAGISLLVILIQT